MTKPKTIQILVPQLEVMEIPSYEGLYSVSKNGDVWSHPKETGVSRHGGQWLKPWVTNGYLVVSLKRSDGVKRKQYVHRIVAMAWIPNPDPEARKFINHKDSNRGNPSITNLEWCSRSMNLKHAYDNGRRGMRSKQGSYQQAQSA